MNPQDNQGKEGPEANKEDTGRAEAETEEAQHAAAEDESSAQTAVVLTVEEYEELKAAAAERDHYLKRLQRAVADYQNLQKRIAKLSVAASRNAIKEVALQVVPLADSLAQALSAVEESEGAEKFRVGLHLIEKEFYAILGRLGIEPIQAVGQPFDPHCHEAALQLPAEGVEPNTVVKELKKGFARGNEVIRPSQVAVAAPPEGTGERPATNEQSQTHD